MSIHSIALDAPAATLGNGGKISYKSGGAVLRKEALPMAQFLVNVLAAIVAGVLVALILRYL